MVLGLILLVLGALLAIVGHRSGRMQMRAIGVGLAVFGLVTLLLPIIFG